MNDHDLITAVRDSFTDVHSDTPVRSRSCGAAARCAPGAGFPP